MNEKQKWNPQGFVAAVIRRAKEDTAFRAAMRRADIPQTAAFAWEHLAAWCDIASDRERLAFALAGAAIAREQPDADGRKNLGEVFHACCPDRDAREREQRRFRRLLGCDSAEELCEVLRPVLRYLQNKAPGGIGYATLLTDILYWNERVKLRWARSFFGHAETADTGEENHVSD